MELLLYVSLSTRICEEWQTVVLVSLVVLENSLIWPDQQAGGPAWTGALVGAHACASARLDVRHLHLQTGLRYLSFALASVEITAL